MHGHALHVKLEKISKVSRNPFANIYKQLSLEVKRHGHSNHSMFTFDFVCWYFFHNTNT